MEPSIKKTYDKKLKKEFNIIIPYAMVDDRVNKYVDEIRPKVSQKGFRKGMVPNSVIREKYGQSIVAEELDKLVSETVRNLIKEHDIKLAITPKVDFESEFKEGQDVTLKACFEIYPEIPEIDLKKVKAVKREVEITEEDIKESTEQFLKANSTWEEKEDSYKAKKGDSVNIDYVGKIDKKEFEGGQAKGYQLELGSGSFIDNFEDQLIGKKAGDGVLVKVKFPKNYHNKEYAGKAAEFDVKVNKVLTGKTPELTDEFVKNTFGLENQEKLKEALKSQVENKYSSMSRNLFKKDLFEFLNKKYNFDLPEGLVERQLEALWKEVENELQQNPDKFKNEKEKEKEKAKKRDDAERMIRCGMIVADISHKNKIDVTQQDINQEIGKILGQFPAEQQAELIKNLQNNNQIIDNLKGSLIEEKTVDFIINLPSLDKKKLSTKDFEKIWKKENES